MFFVLHNSGTGGNMVSAVIDSVDYQYSDVEVHPRPSSLRQKLKLNLIKWHNDNKKDCRDLFFDGKNKSSFYKELEQKYISVTTGHDLTFVQHEHDIKDMTIILIDDSDYKYGKWAMERAHAVLPNHHPDFSEGELTNRINRINIAKKFNPKIIPLRDILEGRLIEILQQWFKTPLNTEMYDIWLKDILVKYSPVNL